MNPTVQAAIDRELALLTPIQDPASEPLGYGVDLSCVTDCDASLTEVDPFSTVALGQALLRRLITTRGTLPDDLDYGFDLRSYLNRGVTATDLDSLGGRIEGELMKDDRIVLVKATVAFDARRSLLIKLLVTPQTPYGKTFNLVFSVTDSQVLINTLST